MPPDAARATESFICGECCPRDLWQRTLASARGDPLSASARPGLSTEATGSYQFQSKKTDPKTTSAIPVPATLIAVANRIPCLVN